jgi:hypothetical protein
LSKSCIFGNVSPSSPSFLRFLIFENQGQIGDGIQDTMPNTKIDPDIKRYTRYQSVINILLTTEAELDRHQGRSYESAAELLARIISKREATQKSRRIPEN